MSQHKQLRTLMLKKRKQLRDTEFLQPQPHSGEGGGGGPGGGGGGGGGASASNPVGINFNIGSAEIFPMFKNRVRESRGFTVSFGSTVQVALSAAGWPTADFFCVLAEGLNSTASWIIPGSFACGFLTTTGTETITPGGGSTVTNIVRGSVGTYTTFDYTLTQFSSTPNFSITGTSGEVKNVFAFLPAYRSMAPSAGTTGPIDDPTTASAFTNETIQHYQQYAHVRCMGYSKAQYNTLVSTSVTRRTPANTQAKQDWDQFPPGSGIGALTAAPGNGATSATLTANWPLPSGSYGIPMNSPNNIVGRICTMTKGATTMTWTTALAEASNSTNIPNGAGFEGYPIEWAIALCNACNIGILINTPLIEDGTNSSAGSWSAAVMDYLNAHWTSKGNIYFEWSDEVWNFQLPGARLVNALGSVYGFTADTFGTAYIAYRLHAFANLCRTKFPTTFGTKVFHLFGWQTVGLSNSALILSKLALLGTVNADIQFFTTAPYVTPTIGNTDSIALIESTTATAGAVQALNSLSENDCILALKYGVALCTYESGGQWNVVNQNNANVGLAIMDPGMTPALTGYYQAVFDSGFSFISHTNSGVTGSNSNTSPTLELSNVYASPLSSPTLSALQSFMGGATPRRNVISGAGTINGVNYADNSAVIVNSPGAFNLTNGGTFYSPYLVAGYLPYLVNCSKPGNYTLTGNFTVSSGNPTTSVEVNGVVLRTGIPVVTGTVNLGGVTLKAGPNYVLLGQAGSQTGVAVNSLTFT